MNILSKISIGLLVTCILFFSIIHFYHLKHIKKDGISADFNFLPPASVIASNERLAYIYSLIGALDKFKDDHKYYPITPNRGEDWSIIHIHDKDGIGWINGIIPAYMQNLPYHAIKNPNNNEQYAYQSDGANYKIVVYFPPDCENVEILSSMMIKNNRHDICVGYGFWTRGSKWDTNPPIPDVY